MKRLNKFSSIILSLIFALSVFAGIVFASGCNKPEPDPGETPPVTEPVPPEEEPPAEEVEEVKVGIGGKTEVFSGGKVTLSAVVSGAEDETVTWAVTEGGEYAEIDQKGVLTAKEVSDDKIIKVTATSKADGTAKAERTIIITSKRELTQNMLDLLNGKDVIAFEGYLDIDLYTIGAHERFSETHNTNVKTSMDGTNWYAEYDNSATGLTMALYYRNHNDIACQVGVSLTNSEEYSPMLDDNDEQVSWTASGLYNNFKGLKVSDFEFNNESWRYEYKGADDSFIGRAVASANPYDFEPTSFSLIIEDGEIIGFRSVSAADFTIAQGYKAIQTLTVAINYGETVTVPSVEKYEHHEAHDKLTEAIANMQTLDSYTLDFKQNVYSVLTSGYTYEGFKETITDEICYFEPYTLYNDEYGDEQQSPTGKNYGYKKINDNLYNTFSKDEKKGYVANRAYASDFKNAKPSFEFAAEIFTSYYQDPEDGSTTYYVDEPMCPVASKFYYGVGNDISLYGVFASRFNSSSTSFTPYVVVKDGYIIESGFYFYLGYLYGIVEIKYSDFGTAEMPSDASVEFEARQVPSSWSELTIQVTDTDSEGTSGDVETNALVYLKKFFNDEEIEEKMPFFGTPLGDSYGFGMTTIHFNSENKVKESIMFYYDVPLDTDYSINSSLEKVGEYLLSLGFTKNKYGEFSNGEMVVAPVDNDLDLMIYVWKA